MSIKVMNYVWQNSKQPPSSKLILLAMADFADDSGFCFPSGSTLAKKTNLTRRQVVNIIKQLVIKNEIIILRRGGNFKGKGLRSNKYRVKMEREKISHSERENFSHLVGNTASESVKPISQGPPRTTIQSFTRAGARVKKSSISSDPSSKAVEFVRMSAHPYKTAASLKSLREMRSDIERDMEEILYPGGCALATPDPGNLTRLDRLRLLRSQVIEQIQQLLKLGSGLL